MLDAAAEVASFALPSDLENQALSSGSALAGQMGVSEWLGPLAPVALSPFFGLCMLSGLATYGPEWIRERNSLLDNSQLLGSPWLFWTMLALSVLTSLPRFTKVSKPLGLAAENLEAYSSVIILFAVRMLGNQPTADPDLQAIAPGLQAVTSEPMLAAGFLAWSTSLMLALFAALNVLVINGVKLFIEFLIWLIPFPAIDAMLEGTNKTLCVGLMTVYAFSPLLATVINLSLLVACAIAFGWTQRRLHFYQSIVLGPILAWWFPGWFAQRGEWFPVVCDQPLQGLPRYTRLHMRLGPDDQVELRGRWWWRSLHWQLEPCRLEIQPQLVARRLMVYQAGQATANLLHRRWVASDACYARFGEAERKVSAPAAQPTA